MSDTHLTALIIGCGRSAAGIQRADGSTGYVGHAEACADHPRMTLAACVDPKRERRERLAAAHGIPVATATLAEALDATGPCDLAIVASPTETHGPVLAALVEAPVRAVLCEKPAGGDADTIRQVGAALERAGKPFVVNYPRRFVPELQDLAGEIVRGDWGALQAATCLYTKGLMHNGSHHLDLLAMLTGSLTVVSSRPSRLRGEMADPTIDAVFSDAGGAPVHLVGCDARRFRMADVTMVFDRGSVAVENSGFAIRRRQVVDDPIVGDQRCLDAGRIQATDQSQATRRALEHLIDVLETGARPLCGAAEAAATAEICAEARDLAQHRKTRAA